MCLWFVSLGVPALLVIKFIKFIKYVKYRKYATIAFWVAPQRGYSMAREILTTTETAQLLGVSVRTAQMMIEGGAVPSWKTPGGHRRVYRADVQALISGSGQPKGHQPQSREISVFQAKSILASHGDLAFPVAPNELQRLAAVERSGLVDSDPEEIFDRLTWLASHTLKAPFALFTTITSDRQWFKSKQGLDLKETPRNWAFCNYTILQQGVFSVENLSIDERFANNPAVEQDPKFRFYAGAPVVDADGFALSTLR